MGTASGEDGGGSPCIYQNAVFINGIFWLCREKIVRTRPTTSPKRRASHLQVCRSQKGYGTIPIEGKIYTRFAWAGGTCPRFAWAGGIFSPVILLCQFLVLAGNRFWFYILLMYLGYRTIYRVVLVFLVLAGNSFWC